MNEPEIRKRVAIINRKLDKSGLVTQTFGNASARDPLNNDIYIKPSGVPFSKITPTNIVRTDSEGANYGESKPSVDLPVHIEIYNNFSSINGVIHTHSHYATVFAQAKKSIPCLGTTHADYFRRDIPVIRDLYSEEIENNYEKNLGRIIVSFFGEKKLNSLDISAVLVPSHGPFVWGETIESAFEKALALEEIAKLAFHTLVLGRNESCSANTMSIKPELVEKHFSRKHGKNKYYGQ